LAALQPTYRVRLCRFACPQCVNLRSAPADTVANLFSYIQPEFVRLLYQLPGASIKLSKGVVFVSNQHNDKSRACVEHRSRAQHQRQLTHS
jgi:hypothetical protein